MAQHSLSNYELCHETIDSEKRAQKRAGVTSVACACSLQVCHWHLNHRFHRLSICNAVPYRACVGDQEYQIDNRTQRCVADAEGWCFARFQTRFSVCNYTLLKVLRHRLSCPSFNTTGKARQTRFLIALGVRRVSVHVQVVDEASSRDRRGRQSGGWTRCKSCTGV